MKILSTLLVSSLALPASAAVPRKKNANDYSVLWNNSIFTSKPAPPPPGEQVSAFADWTLGGVSEIDGGHMITLFNTKKQGESMIIRPDLVILNRGDAIEHLKPGDAGTFTVANVEYGKTTWKDTVVTLASAGRTGPVKFDDAQIQPRAAAPPPQQPRPGQLPPGVQPGGAQQAVPGMPGQQPQAGGAGQRQGRPRVVPQPQQGQQQPQPQQQQQTQQRRR